jgi:hypothetical protein
MATFGVSTAHWACLAKHASPTDFNGHRENAMYALDPAVMQAMALLIAAIAGLIRAIWPNGVFK